MNQIIYIQGSHLDNYIYHKLHSFFLGFKVNQKFSCAQKLDYLVYPAFESSLFVHFLFPLRITSVFTDANACT